MWFKTDAGDRVDVKTVPAGLLFKTAPVPFIRRKVDGEEIEAVVLRGGEEIRIGLSLKALHEKLPDLTPTKITDFSDGSFFVEHEDAVPGARG